MCSTLESSRSETGVHLFTFSISIRGEVWHLEEELGRSAPPLPNSETTRTLRPTERSKRSRRRSRSIRVSRLGQSEVALAAERAAALEEGLTRPTTRSDCADALRPCPHVACRHHLYLDVNPDTGTIKLNFPDLEVWELTDTCALDVAERGATSLDDVSLLLNVTRERVRQIETQAMLKLENLDDLHELRQVK